MDSEADSTQDELTPAVEPDAGTAGERLRAQREAKRLDIAHVAAETRIPQRHLAAIEAGDFSELPSRTYAIGFARSYARAVDLDDQEIAALVREELADGAARQSAMSGGMEPGDPAKLPSAGLAWFGAFAALILAIGVFAFASTYFGAGADLGSLIASDDSEDPASSGASNEALAADGEGAGDGNIAPALTADGQVIFTALEDEVWVRFYEDGGDRLFEDVMEAGESFELPTDATEPRINTGRPDAFAITIGGRDVPKLAEEPVTMGDTPISAAALLARADTGDGETLIN